MSAANPTCGPADGRPLPPLLALSGPTAAGKTAVALAVAARWPVEIISVDSALVYRGMDIGTAKPSAAERAQVVHHLIDIRDPLHAYSAADFVRDVNTLLHDIAARGKLPLLVGGTLLYLKALRDGLDALPAADPALRATIQAEAAQRGWPALHAELAQVDAATAARLAPNDSQRIGRALEVLRATGTPLSALHTGRGHTGPADAVSKPPQPAGAHPELTLISLEPLDRAWLHQRIAQRFDQMLAAGLLDEVATLRARGDLNPDLPSMRCVGYRQAWQALDGTFPLSELRERGVAATRQLAKRQITWLRSMPDRLAVAAEAPDADAQVMQQLERLLESSPCTR